MSKAIPDFTHELMRLGFYDMARRKAYTEHRREPRDATREVLEGLEKAHEEQLRKAMECPPTNVTDKLWMSMVEAVSVEEIRLEDSYR